MSLNSALLAGTSGLLSNSGALAAISDNIANVNTTGYKRTITTFNPLVKANSNAIAYTAGGVGGASRQLVAQQGILASSAGTTDIGISGAGFFTVTSRAENLGPEDSYLFTRSGAFEPDENGFLINTAGYYLQGWPVQADGTVTTNPSDLTQLQTVNVGAIGGTAEATTRLQFNANLDATVTGVVSPATYTVGDMALNVTTGAGGVTPDFQTNIQVFDSLGTLQAITFAFKKKDPALVAPNQWYMEAFANPPTAVDGTANGLILSGDVNFDSNGQILLGNAAGDSTFSSVDANGLPQIQLGAFNAGAGIRWANATGASGSTIDIDFGGAGSTGGMSQLNSDSAIISTSVNGSTFGDLADIEVDDDGFVLAKFNNGIIRQVYQLPVATFQNPNGLTPENGGAYRVSNESGQFTLKQPGVGGAGLISPQSLESSNVDLATEFTGLITTQRAYSAASKIITTADEMLEELIRIKR